MNFRTGFAAIAAVGLLAGLAACGGDDDKDTASSGSSGSSNTATQTPAGSTDHSDMPGMGSGEMITMKNLAFTPKDLTVAPGTEIMVENADSARHDLKDTATKGKKFDTGDLEAGKDGSFKAPTEPGDYPYVCTYHFGMEGTLHVK